MTTGKKEKSAAATAALAGNNGFSLISNKKLLDLYSSLVKCLMIEARVRHLSKSRGAAGAGTTVSGREAGAVGVVIDLLPEDVVVCSSGDFIVSVIKGESLTSVFGSLFASSASRARVGDFSKLIKTAMNAAKANKAERNGRIAVVFCNEEPSLSSIWHKALMNAGANRLPMIFVCYSALAAGQKVSDEQSTLEKIGLEGGIPVIPVDGCDLVAIYRVATECITHARKGNGASLIHCVTLHSADRAENDPIVKMEAYLSRKGLFRDGLKREVAGSIAAELDAAVEAAEKSAFSQ